LEHPHLQHGFKQNKNHSPNVVYVATERLSLPGLGSPEVAGAGTFPRFFSKLRPTKEDSNLSNWLLPSWFWHENPLCRLSYHAGPEKSWRSHEHPLGVELESVGRGQEFVLNCDHYSEAIPWVWALFDSVGLS
jgi:hypothetical protein